ncbi:MAG: hypothetical protein TH68_01355 [Candidatus Synechococcus spongiarum 142]|uniref:Uncharacterized protein n=1 Tax=Candidatus Synechococcus spongiarum 142 TaxID=1608213 RepID=A0A6N3X9X5_9SYNE|nr:MAG: hypothetical protein TH68_01355 [Candidatus Synechococcus spongiarum 142]
MRKERQLGFSDYERSFMSKQTRGEKRSLQVGSSRWVTIQIGMNCSARYSTPREGEADDQ